MSCCVAGLARPCASAGAAPCLAEHAPNPARPAALLSAAQRHSKQASRPARPPARPPWLSVSPAAAMPSSSSTRNLPPPRAPVRAAAGSVMRSCAAGACCVGREAGGWVLGMPGCFGVGKKGELEVDWAKRTKEGPARRGRRGAGKGGMHAHAYTARTHAHAQAQTQIHMLTHARTHVHARAQRRMRTCVLLAYFLSEVPYLRSTRQRPKPRSRLALFMTMASSMSYLRAWGKLTDAWVHGGRVRACGMHGAGAPKVALHGRSRGRAGSCRHDERCPDSQIPDRSAPCSAAPAWACRVPLTRGAEQSAAQQSAAQRSTAQHSALTPSRT